MSQTVVPQLRITDARRSLTFYVDGLGFRVDWEHRFGPGFPLFLQLTRAGQSIFLTEHEGDCKVGGAVYITLPDVDAYHRELVSRGIITAEPPSDTPGLPREMVLTDPDGNRLRFAQRSGVEAPRSQPLIAVADVEASSRWYQRLLGCRSAHGGANYERLECEGVLVLQLHRWETDHAHVPIGDPERKPHGNGVLLWFEVDDFDAAAARAAELGAEVVMDRHRNPPSGDGGPSHWELWLRDPDGYRVVLASPDGTAAERC
jgi:catechol 2,3-dioxygenase-like lactoylglutathione lyase family enzyme